MKNEGAIFLLAVQFMTRLPIASDKLYTPERLNAAARYYPLVGLLVGGICAGSFWGLLFMFPIPLAVLLSTTIGLLVTGAFHEDGLADTFDGLGGGHTREQALTIMKDSRLGTYGTLALVTVLAIKVATLSSLPTAQIIIALVAAHGLSRLSSVIVILTSQYARENGTAKPVASGLSLAGALTALTVGALALAGAALFAPAAALLWASSGMVIGHIGMRLMFERKLGGYTGDTLGAVQQVSELGFYLGWLAWLS
ncbi:MAG: adenosylcobinamide-GDP ribazoletransferase [Pseudomonadota bacterium]